VTGVGALGDRTRLLGLVLRAGARAAKRRLGALARTPLTLAGRTPEKLLIAPHDLRTSDPTRAGEIYSGVFAFAGRTVETEGRSPFQVPPPSPEWSAALHGFGWLRHLRAADTSLSRANARALVDEWIALRGGHDAPAFAPDVTARRLISWYCHAPLVLNGADAAFYRRFLRSLGRQTRRLGRDYGRAPDGLPRLTVAAALAYAGLCLSGEGRLAKSAAAELAGELDRQILPDGGHISRNPSALVAVLLDLLPLRQAFTARNMAPPPALMNAIDRMMPMLRFFRHGDGEFAQFNGAGPAPADQTATILAYDDVRGRPHDDAPHSGYQRLFAGDALALIDSGGPPPVELSREAHAGCLSFEFSIGAERVVVNCGAPRFGREDWEAAARATAAHSTLTIGGVSSCAFAPKRLKRLLHDAIVAGPKEVVSRREATSEGVRVVARHDGYLDRFGVIHERALRLSADGRRLEGEDLLRPARPSAPTEEDPRVALRFHLHPLVRASARQDGQGVVLALPSGAGWAFSAPGFPVELEDSVHLSGPLGPRRAEQIVIHATVKTASRVAWSFESLEPESQPRGRRLPTAASLFEEPQAAR
jgi:uncharacterized heparinase superfamily protein